MEGFASIQKQVELDKHDFSGFLPELVLVSPVSPVSACGAVSGGNLGGCGQMSGLWSLEPGRWTLVLQKVPSEANPKVRNHGEGPY